MFMTKITQQEWLAFEYVEQEGLSIPDAANKMGLTNESLIDLLKGLAEKEPELFCCDSEAEYAESFYPHRRCPFKVIRYTPALEKRIVRRF